MDTTQPEPEKCEHGLMQPEDFAYAHVTLRVTNVNHELLILAKKKGLTPEQKALIEGLALGLMEALDGFQQLWPSTKAEVENAAPS